MLQTFITLLMILGVVVTVGGVLRAALCNYFEQFYLGVLVTVVGLVTLFSGVVLGFIYL